MTSESLGYVPRVVVVSSGGMLTEGLVTSNIEMRKKSQKFDGVKQYARGKRHQVALVERWARIESERSNGPSSNGAYVGYYSMHPGWCETNGVKNALPKFYESMRGKLRTPAQGADTILYLLFADADTLKPGGFYFDRELSATHLVGGFTKYKVEAVDYLASKLEAMATESSVRSEKSFLRSGSSSKNLNTFASGAPSS
jgi:dehydrogenase/reductase SDR family protein 12